MLPSHLRKDRLEKVGYIAHPDHPTVDRDRRRITQYGRTSKTGPKESGTTHTHLLRAVALGVGPLHRRAMPAPHCQVH